MGKQRGPKKEDGSHFVIDFTVLLTSAVQWPVS